MISKLLSDSEKIKMLPILWLAYAEAQFAHADAVKDIPRATHWYKEIGDCNEAIHGLRFDESIEDITKARLLGYEIEYAMGRAWYINPKEAGGENNGK